MDEVDKDRDTRIWYVNAALSLPAIALKHDLNRFPE